MKHLALLGFVFGLGTTRWAAVAAEDAPPPLTLTPVYINQLAEEMRTNHPALLAAAARTNAAGANIASIRTWENPKVLVGGMVAQRSMREEDGDIIYGIEQPLPLFGKASRARRVAGAEAAMESAGATLKFQTLRRDMAKAAFRTARREETIVLEAEDISWLEAMASTLESRYRAGQSMLSEVLLVQNERGRKVAQLAADKDLLVHDHFTLNRFLNRKEGSPWPRFTLPPLADEVPYNEMIARFAMKYEPQVAVLQKEVDLADSMADSTRQEKYPNLNFGLESRNYSGNGEFRQGMFFLSMDVPWFNRGKYRDALSRDRHRAAAARHELEDYLQELRQEVHLLVVRIAAARREALVYEKEIIPRSESALASARAAWETGQGLFRDVIEARRMLVEAKQMRSRSVAEQYEMLTELVLCCGVGDLEALQMLADGKEPGTSK